jgi:hypothetical protein
MAPHDSSGTTVSPGMGPEQHQVSPRLALAEPPAATRRDRLRPLEVAHCSMCDIALPLGLMVPDGGQACADIRWYCKDARSCTERWTTARPQGPAQTPAVPGTAVAGALEAAPDVTAAGRLDGMVEQAKRAG